MEEFQTQTLEIGLNYWASETATEMWRKWNPDSIEKDIEAFKKYGITILRVFPLWSDFQPIHLIKYCSAGNGQPREMRMGEEEDFLPDTDAGRAGMSEVMLERFRELADIVHRHGIKLIVSIMTAHMTGRSYVPRAMENRDMLRDFTALKWEMKFYDCFVRRMKDHPAIFAWETGNEMNGTIFADTPDEAWVWTKMIHDVIRLADSKHPIVSVPVRDVNPLEYKWIVSDQAELSDCTNIHRYDIRSNGSQDGFNHLRNVFRAVADCRMVEDVGNKPCFIEETGTWRNTVASLEGMGRAVRNILWNAWADGCRSLLWWCAFDQEKFDIAPYNWGDWPGLEHGVFTTERKPHPAAEEMLKFRKVLDSLPFGSLPATSPDAVCLIDDAEIAFSAFVLARQAGINLKFHATRNPLPESGFYFVPSCVFRGGISTADWEKLLAGVRNGAALYLSFEDCNLPRLKDVCGMEIEVRRKSAVIMDYSFDGFTLKLPREIEKLVSAETAEVIGREKNGNPVFLKNSFGKGTVYTLMFPLEKTVFETPGGFDTDAWKIYRKMLPKDFLLQSDDPAVILTEHPFNESSAAVVAVNCCIEARSMTPGVHSGWRISGVTGDASLNGEKYMLPPNSGCVFLMEKK